jgi:hypothetical protein
MNSVLYVLLPLVEQAPADEDVKAGWVAFGLFLALGIAVVLLAFSLVKHLKRARRNFDEMEEGSAEERRTPPTD